MYIGGTATGSYQLGVQHVGLSNTPTGRPKKRFLFSSFDPREDVKS